ncbi:unnamed protein product [Rhizophagus irregularis]|uniref:Uncharacterized protein n=1 Tax=Rhizophagus irregularis TaxID=588596 RepID=A0A916EDW0_9GLOM|nr:unnamed protein product [Rhizophagus irregularis]
MIKEKAFLFCTGTRHNGASGEEKRNKIRCCRLHGEANSVPLETFLEEWRKLQQFCKITHLTYSMQTKLNSFFVWHLIKLFLLQVPNWTHITVLLATNAIGTQNSNHLPGCEVIFLSAFLSPNTTAHGCRHYGGSMLPNVTRVYAGACIIKSFKTIVRNFFDELRESWRCSLYRNRRDCGRILGSGVTTVFIY